MSIIVVSKKAIKFDSKEIPFEDLYSKEFYSYSNKWAHLFNTDIFSVNELFSHLVQPFLALNFFVDKQDVDCINIQRANGKYKLFAFDIAQRKCIPVIGHVFIEEIAITAKSFFVRFLSFLYLNYLMISIPFAKETIKPHSKFAVLRTKAAMQKFKAFADICKEIEDVTRKDSIYRLFSKRKRIIWVWKSYFKSFSSLRQIKSVYRPLLGKHSIFFIDIFYQKRIVHALLYERLMREYMSHFKGCTFYTGNNLDRFSVIEENLAKEYGIKTVCYPHGLEYGYKFPKGFSCDVFYANSEFAAKELNRVYETNKFTYDEEITKKMFELKGVPEHPKHVVFFTEQQEYHVNKAILTELQPLLEKDGIEVFVKLHPGDTKDHYTDCNFKYITDYGESLTGNICVSRKSTVLLEAIYNNSTAIAIITTQKDKSVFDTFPSLQSERIIKTYNVQDLYKDIIKHI